MTREENEKWDLFTRDGELVQENQPANQVIPEGLYHKTVTVLLKHEDDSYLALQRPAQDNDMKNHYEVTISGNVPAGEDEWQAALNLLQRKTGINGQDWQEALSFVIEEEHCLYYFFFCKTDADKDSVQLLDGEAADYKWISLDQAVKMREQSQLTGMGANWLNIFHRHQQQMQEIENIVNEDDK